MTGKIEAVAGYQELSALLAAEIQEGRYPPGSQLPPELEIGRRYHLNRHTVRRALEVLAQEGLIYRLQGKGTFVARQKIPYRVSRKTRFTTAILEAGCRPQAALVDSSEVRADQKLAKYLEVEPGTGVTVLEIVRSAETLPFCLTRSYLVTARFPGLAAHFDRLFFVIPGVAGALWRRIPAGVLNL